MAIKKKKTRKSGKASAAALPLPKKPIKSTPLKESFKPGALLPGAFTQKPPFQTISDPPFIGGSGGAPGNTRNPATPDPTNEAIKLRESKIAQELFLSPSQRRVRGGLDPIPGQPTFAPQTAGLQQEITQLKSEGLPGQNQSIAGQGQLQGLPQAQAGGEQQFTPEEESIQRGTTFLEIFRGLDPETPFIGGLSPESTFLQRLETASLAFPVASAASAARIGVLKLITKSSSVMISRGMSMPTMGRIAAGVIEKSVRGAGFTSGSLLRKASFEASGEYALGTASRRILANPKNVASTVGILKGMVSGRRLVGGAITMAFGLLGSYIFSAMDWAPETKGNYLLSLELAHGNALEGNSPELAAELKLVVDEMTDISTSSPFAMLKLAKLNLESAGLRMESKEKMIAEQKRKELAREQRDLEFAERQDAQNARFDDKFNAEANKKRVLAQRGFPE